MTMASLTINGFANASDRTTFEIFCDQCGHWCARRRDGLVFGTFFEREPAMRFARRESGPQGCIKIAAAINSSPPRS